MSRSSVRFRLLAEYDRYNVSVHPNNAETITEKRLHTTCSTTQPCDAALLAESVKAIDVFKRRRRCKGLAVNVGKRPRWCTQQTPQLSGCRRNEVDRSFSAAGCSDDQSVEARREATGAKIRVVERGKRRAEAAELLTPFSHAGA